MPGTVSEAIDLQIGIDAQAPTAREHFRKLYGRVPTILNQRASMPINELIDAELPTRIAAALTEKEWRLLRFALETAIKST